MEKIKLIELIDEDILLNESANDKIVVKGVGTYTKKSLTKILQEKAKSLNDIAKTEKFDKIPSSAVDVFFNM
jgi:hypothetical protein